METVTRGARAMGILQRVGIAGVVLGMIFISSAAFSQEDIAGDEGMAIPKSGPVIKSEPAAPKDIFELNIPAAWGTIKEIYKGTSDKVIVHIQDAHCNYECQNNIGNIVDLLVSEYGVTAAGIEGSSGRLQTELFSTFPEDAIRQQTADYFVREGKLSGVEALAIAKGMEYPLVLYGIEDDQLYKNNFDAFQSSLPFKDEAKGYFNQLNRCLGQLKSHLHTPELSNLDEQQLAFALNVLSLNDYCLFLSKSLGDKARQEKEFPNAAKLLNAVAIEQELDFTKAEEERTKLLTELTNVASEADIQKLLDKGLAYKNGQLSAARYLAFVKELAGNNKIDLSQYKNLDKYIDYARSYDEIKSFELYNEIEEMDAAIRSKLYTSEEQRTLDLLVRGLKVMGRLVDIKMVNRDLAFYQENADALQTDRYLAFIKAEADKFGIAVTIPQNISYLDVYIPAWVEFYRVAGLRDASMITNTTAIMAENKQKVGIMITGGFHTRELTRRMKEQGISFIVITPRITQNIPGPYFDRLTGKKTALDIFMESANAVVPESKASGSKQ